MSATRQINSVEVFNSYNVHEDRALRFGFQNFISINKCIKECARDGKSKEDMLLAVVDVLMHEWSVATLAQKK